MIKLVMAAMMAATFMSGPAQAANSSHCNILDNGSGINKAELSAFDKCWLDVHRADEDAGIIKEIAWVRLDGTYYSVALSRLRNAGSAEAAAKLFQKIVGAHFIIDVLESKLETLNLQSLNQESRIEVLESIMDAADEVRVEYRDRVVYQDRIEYRDRDVPGPTVYVDREVQVVNPVNTMLQTRLDTANMQLTTVNNEIAMVRTQLQTAMDNAVRVVAQSELNGISNAISDYISGDYSSLAEAIENMTQSELNALTDAQITTINLYAVQNDEDIAIYPDITVPTLSDNQLEREYSGSYTLAERNSIMADIQAAAAETDTAQQLTDIIAVMDEIKAEIKEAYNHGYQDGYSDGYKDGYNDGYKDGVESVS